MKFNKATITNETNISIKLPQHIDLKKYQFIVGIDPDIDKSGVAIYNTVTKELKLHNWALWFELYDYICESLNSQTVNGIKVLFLIEIGEKNKTNFHGFKYFMDLVTGKKRLKSSGMNKYNVAFQYASAIGNDVGKNFEIANVILKLCQSLKLDTIEIRPEYAKIENSNDFNSITGLNITTNQEKRDAAMLIIRKFCLNKKDFIANEK